MTLNKATSLAAAALVLTACGYTTDFRDVNRNFGYATTQNALIQTGSGLANVNEYFNRDTQTTVNFDFNSTVLDAAARATLDRQAAFINSFPMVRFSVYGHTDQVGSEAYNKGLGLRRAQTVVAYLVSRGVSSSRVEAVVSRGKSEPIVNSGGRERVNRRAITQVAGMAPGYNGFDFDGKRAAIIYDEYVKGKGEEVTDSETQAVQ